MANIRVARAFCIMDRDPSVGAMMDDFDIPMNAAKRVQSGAYCVNIFENANALVGIKSVCLSDGYGSSFGNTGIAWSTSA